MCKLVCRVVGFGYYGEGLYHWIGQLVFSLTLLVVWSFVLSRLVVSTYYININQATYVGDAMRCSVAVASVLKGKLLQIKIHVNKGI